MTTFKNVVDFLKDRADVINHPVLSKPTENTLTPVKPKGKPTPQRASSYVVTSSTTEPCFLCSKLLRIYQCDAFKLKSVKEREKQTHLL